jgi:hypothetical protein
MITCTKFHGVTVDCLLTWLNHIDLLTKNYLIASCYLIQNIKPYLSVSVLKITYLSIFINYVL